MRSVQDGAHRDVLDSRRLIGSGDELGYNGIDGGHGVNGKVEGKVGKLTLQTMRCHLTGFILEQVGRTMRANLKPLGSK